MMAVLKSQLPAIRQESQNFLELSLRKTSLDMLEIIRQLVPVDTGDLRDSYTYEFVDQHTIRIGSSMNRGVRRRPYLTYYAPYVEGLEGDNIPQPHFIPAWIRARQIFTKHFSDLIKEF